MSLRRSLKQIISAATERVASSFDAASRREYEWLGVTDAALLILAEAGAVLLTADALLHDAAGRAGYESINFIHLKAEREGL